MKNPPKGGWVEWSWHPWYRLARRGCRKIAQGTRPRGPFGGMRCQTVVRKVRMVCFSVGCEFPVRKRSKIIRVFLKWRNIWVFPEMEGSPQKQLNLVYTMLYRANAWAAFFATLWQLREDDDATAERWPSGMASIPKMGGSPRRSSPNPFDGEWLFNLFARLLAQTSKVASAKAGVRPNLDFDPLRAVSIKKTSGIFRGKQRTKEISPYQSGLIAMRPGTNRLWGKPKQASRDIFHGIFLNILIILARCSIVENDSDR